MPFFVSFCQFFNCHLHSVEYYLVLVSHRFHQEVHFACLPSVMWFSFGEGPEHQLSSETVLMNVSRTLDLAKIVDLKRVAERCVDGSISVPNARQLFRTISKVHDCDCFSLLSHNLTLTTSFFLSFVRHFAFRPFLFF